MTARRFSMTSEPSEQTLSFIVDGVRVSSGEPWEETFALLDDIPPGAQIDLVNAVIVDENGTVGWNTSSIARFVQAVLVPDDEPRWEVLIRDKDRRLDRDKLGGLLFWITGEMTGRPIGRRPSSSDGSPTESNGSEAAVSSPDEQPTGSTPAA